MTWTIVTRMPSTGRLTHWSTQTGSPEDFAACRASWHDTDCVSVAEATEADIERLDAESRGGS